MCRTGSTDGIGVTTGKHLASKGFNVLVHGRDETRIKNAVEAIQAFAQKSAKNPGTVYALPAVDISTVAGSTKLAKDTISLCSTESLDLTVLMNNAGVFSEKLVITEDNLELTFAVNVMATYVVTSYLLPLLLKQRSRIVTASSISQCRSIRDWGDFKYAKRPFSSHAAYSESKLLDAMLTMDFSERLKAAGLGTDRITCNCLDPGTVNTKMLLAGWGRIGIDVKDALGQTYLCSSDEVVSMTGKYFVSNREARASADAYDPREQGKLWRILSQVAPDAAIQWNNLQV